MGRIRPLTVLLMIGLMAFAVSCRRNLPDTSDSSSSELSEFALDASQVYPSIKASHVQAFALEPLKAPALAEKDFKNGQCNLYSVYGYGPYIPGVKLILKTQSTESAPRTYNKPMYQLIYVEGTSDTGGLFDAQGKAFANAYNQVAVKNCGRKK